MAADKALISERKALLGDMRQIGYVVEDIEAEMDHWASTLGVGPWFYAEAVRFESYEYQGVPQTPRVSIALANTGAMQIELIQTRCETPTSYRAFLAAGRSGPQHVAYWPDDYDQALSALTQSGYAVDQSGEINKPGRFAYLVHPSDGDRVIEISETRGPKGKLFAYIAEAARVWDGSDPVRVMRGSADR